MFQEKTERERERETPIALTGFQRVLINIGESSEINYWPTETALTTDGFLLQH